MTLGDGGRWASVAGHGAELVSGKVDYDNAVTFKENEREMR